MSQKKNEISLVEAIIGITIMMISSIFVLIYIFNPEYVGRFFTPIFDNLLPFLLLLLLLLVVLSSPNLLQRTQNYFRKRSEKNHFERLNTIEFVIKCYNDYFACKEVREWYSSYEYINPFKVKEFYLPAIMIGTYHFYSKENYTFGHQLNILDNYVINRYSIHEELDFACFRTTEIEHSYVKNELYQYIVRISKEKQIPCEKLDNLHRNLKENRVEILQSTDAVIKAWKICEDYRRRAPRALDGLPSNINVQEEANSLVNQVKAFLKEKEQLNLIEKDLDRTTSKDYQIGRIINRMMILLNILGESPLYNPKERDIYREKCESLIETINKHREWLAKNPISLNDKLINKISKDLQKIKTLVQDEVDFIKDSFNSEIKT